MRHCALLTVPLLLASAVFAHGLDAQYTVAATAVVVQPFPEPPALHWAAEDGRLMEVATDRRSGEVAVLSATRVSAAADDGDAPARNARMAGARGLVEVVNTAWLVDRTSYGLRGTFREAPPGSAPPRQLIVTRILASNS